jgi:DNA-binding GntR family transcriptional regulator
LLYHVYKIQVHLSLDKGGAPLKHRLQKIRKNSLKEQVITAIRNAIIEGKFRPGEKIPEHELAEQLGVSRTPIREAIHILEQQGLVVIVPKSGTFIAEVDPEEVQDSLYTRIALEELALRQAIERLSSEEWENLCKRLNHILNGMKEAVKRGNTITATELDIEWHTVLIEAAHNRFLSRVWQAIGLQYLIWSPESNIYPIQKDRFSDIVYINHKELFEIIRRRNPEECSQAIRLHILQRLTSPDAQLNTQNIAQQPVN